MVVPLGECALRKCGPKFIEIFRRMLLHKTPNHAKFCGDRLNNARDIRNRKFVLPKKWAEFHQKNFMECYPLRPPIMPNFIQIGQTSLEKSIKKRYLFGPFRRFFVMDGQKCDYLSRCSQRARGATKNPDPY